jgi:peptide/nickel transport system substrate-binding protein
VLDSYTPDVSIKLKRNPDYYEREKPYLDGIELRVITDESTRMAALRNGTINMTWVASPRAANQMKGVKGVHVDFPKSLRFEEGLEFDHTKPPFDDVRVRRAFSSALNRKEIIDVVLLGSGGLGTKIPPGAQPYGYTSREAANLPYYKENLDLAKRLLKEAGYENGFDTVLQVSPAYYADVPTAQIIQQQVARAGIRIKIQQAEWGKELNDYLQTAQPMTMIGLIPQPDPDGDIYDIFYSKSTINLGKWADPEVDRLLQLGRTTYGAQRRARIYRRIQWVVANQVYMVFPFATPGLWEMWRDNVKGYVPTPGKHRVFLRQAWLA